MTSQSNRRRIAARRSFAVGAACARLRLDPGGDVQRPHGGDRRHPGILAPGQEIRHGTAIGPPRMRIADLRGEELQEADAGRLAGAGDEDGQGPDATGFRGQHLVHAP
jgi:hypothetical protein